MTTGYVVSITMVGDRFRPLSGSGGSSFQTSNEKNPGWLGCIGDYTTQLNSDYNIPL